MAPISASKAKRLEAKVSRQLSRSRPLSHQFFFNLASPPSPRLTRHECMYWSWAGEISLSSRLPKPPPRVNRYRANLRKPTRFRLLLLPSVNQTHSAQMPWRSSLSLPTDPVPEFSRQTLNPVISTSNPTRFLSTVASSLKTPTSPSITANG